MKTIVISSLLAIVALNLACEARFVLRARFHDAVESTVTVAKDMACGTNPDFERCAAVSQRCEWLASEGDGDCVARRPSAAAVVAVSSRSP